MRSRLTGAVIFCYYCYSFSIIYKPTLITLEKKLELESFGTPFRQSTSVGIFVDDADQQIPHDMETRRDTSAGLDHTATKEFVALVFWG
jgi:hypothetical protein